MEKVYDDSAWLNLMEQYKKCQDDVEAKKLQLSEELIRLEELKDRTTHIIESKKQATEDLKELFFKMDPKMAELELLDITHKSRTMTLDKAKESLIKLKKERDMLVRCTDMKLTQRM